jgi:uncharacterized protein YacL
MFEPKPPPKNAPVQYDTFDRIGQYIILTFVFMFIWFACIFTGFVIPMMTFDHGDVESAAIATIFATLGAIIGPILAFFVVRSIHRWAAGSHRT